MVTNPIEPVREAGAWCLGSGGTQLVVCSDTTRLRNKNTCMIFPICFKQNLGKYIRFFVADGGKISESQTGGNTGHLKDRKREDRSPRVAITSGRRLALSVLLAQPAYCHWITSAARRSVR